MKKRILAAVLSMALAAACMTACGESSSTADSTKTSSSQAETTTSVADSSSQSETTATTPEETTTTTTTAQQITTTLAPMPDRSGVRFNGDKITIANANARKVYSALFEQSYDQIKGKTYITDGVAAVESFKDSSDPLEKIVYDKLSKNGGYIYIYYDGDFDSAFVQWSEDKAGTYIGESPNLTTDKTWTTSQFGKRQEKTEFTTYPD